MVRLRFLRPLNAALLIGAAVLAWGCLSLPVQCPVGGSCGTGMYCDCEGFCRATSQGVSVTGCADAGPDAGVDAGTPPPPPDAGDAGPTDDGGLDGGDAGPPFVPDGGPCAILDLAPARYNLAISPWSGTQTGFLLIGGQGPQSECINSPAVTLFQTGATPGYQRFSASTLTWGTNSSAAVFSSQTSFLFGGKVGSDAQGSAEFLDGENVSMWVGGDVLVAPHGAPSGFEGTYGEGAVVTASGSTGISVLLVGGDQSEQSVGNTFDISITPADPYWDVDCDPTGCAGASGLTPREYLGVAITDAGVYAIGGAQKPSNTTLADVQLLPPGASAWVDEPGGLNVSRGYFATAVDGAGTIYVIGGSSHAANTSQALTTMEMLPLGASQWSLAAATLPYGGRTSAVAGYDPSTNRIYVLMGLLNRGAVGTPLIPDNGYDIYDVDAGTWQSCLADGGCIPCSAQGVCSP